MKKYLKYLLALTAVCTLGACTETVNLDDSVDQRVNTVINGYIDELSTAENGWIANVMTDEGVYRFWMEFTNNNVVSMYTDNLHYPKYQNQSQTSTYNIRSLLLPTLSFDTYSYIHIINDPDNNVSFGSNNQGLNTDFEFEINGYQDGVFTLTGRISRVDATLTRATYDEKLAAQQGGMMDVLRQTANYRKGEYCSVEIEGVKVGVIFRPRNLLLMWVDTNGESHQTSALTYTDLNRDVNLIDPVQINGSTITAFRWDEASKGYTAQTTDGTMAPMVVSADPVVPLYTMFGPNKIYSTLITDYYMYANDNTPEEELTELMNNNSFFLNYAMTEYYFYESFGLILQYIAFDFYTTETGRPRMMMTFYVSNAQGSDRVRFSYQLMPDDDTGRFTIGSSISMEDGQISSMVYENATKPICDYMKLRTFQPEWSQVEYATELMGQLRLIHNPNESEGMIYGALY